MTRLSKLGLILAAIHTLVVCIVFLWAFVAKDDYSGPSWVLLLAIDLPAFFMLIFWVGKSEAILFWPLFGPLYLGLVGGVWWFLIGQAVSWTTNRLAVSTAKVRFASGFAISAIVIAFVLAIQFAATIPNTAHDGCAQVGFPFVFLHGCYGTWSLYWSAIAVKESALAVDALVWLAVATLFSYYLRAAANGQRSSSS